jgi:hypothetical protein
VRDTIPPTVSSTSPASNATGIALNAVITATFSENMDANTVTAPGTFTLSNGVTGTVACSGTTATFTPTASLANATTYTATITSAAKNTTGNAMAANKTWTFTTGPDTIPPTVSSTSPAGNATGIALNAVITATFSENMNTNTVTAPGTFTLSNGVTGTVAYSGTTATFTPTASLANATTYTATITTAAQDATGNAMAANKTWTFTTTWPLNDTGIAAGQCYQAGSDVLVACNSAGAIALSPAQDGMAGRDANPAANSNTDGNLGFSFTAVTGGCVQDNVTGLMWEGKTTDGGLRDWTKTYTNYDSTTSAQKNNGSNYVNPSQAEIDAATNTVGFIAAVNASNLCGFNNWRLPTVDELQSIEDYSVAYPGPLIDITWLPNTQGQGYWASSPAINYSGGAWYVDFSYGYSSLNDRTYGYFVRLVRTGP